MPSDLRRWSEDAGAFQLKSPAILVIGTVAAVQCLLSGSGLPAMVADQTPDLPDCHLFHQIAGKEKARPEPGFSQSCGLIT
jgi:hypothetical protein